MMSVRQSIQLLIVAGFSLTFTCLPEGQSHSTEEQLILDFVDFWQLKDVDQLDHLYTKDAIYEDVPDDTAYKGIAAIKQSLSEDITYSPDVKVEVVSILVSENRGVLEWVWSGTQVGDISGFIEATGKTFSIRGVSVFEFENDKIKKQSDYYDAATFLYQLGVKFIFPTTEE
jgi:steroid delta-isomerase-like uncharacterized protein